MAVFYQWNTIALGKTGEIVFLFFCSDSRKGGLFLL